MTQTSPSEESAIDLLEWMKANWKDVQKRRYIIWQDPSGQFSMVSCTEGLIFYTLTPSGELYLLSKEEAQIKVNHLAKELRMRVRRGRPGEINRVFQSQSARIQKLHRWLFNKTLETAAINTYVERTYGLDAKQKEHDRLLPDLNVNPYRAYNHPPGVVQRGPKLPGQ